MDLSIGNEARLDQAVGDEIGDPHRVVHVGLAAGNRLDVRGVGEHKLELALAQHHPDRAPIDAGRLHRRHAAPVRGQPLEQGQQTLGRRLIGPTFPRRLGPGHRSHACDHGVLVDVQSGDPIVHHVHHRLLSIAAGKGASQCEILKSRLRSVAARCASRGHPSAPGPTHNRARKRQ